MKLMERYQQAVDALFAKVRATQTENIIKAGEMIAECASSGGKIYLAEICHSIQMDLQTVLLFIKKKIGDKKHRGQERDHTIYDR